MNRFNEFSVLMSLYHAETAENLNECFRSLQQQTYPASEIIVVFDGPLTDSLYETVKNWQLYLPIHIYQLEVNVGLGKALNYGLNYCNYELVARMDTDDIALPERFLLQITEFNHSPNLSICGSSIDEFINNKENIVSSRVPPLTDNQITDSCTLKNPFNHMTVMYKKHDVIKAGSYLDLPWMEDWYLWLRMISIGCVCKNIEKSLVLARTGSGMITRRSGVKYIESEWSLTRIKVRLGLISWPKSVYFFIIRSLPRLLPKSILAKVYYYSRGNYNVF